MSYLGETGEASAVYRQVDAVAPLKIGSTSARFVAPGSLTGGRFGLFHWDVGEGGGTANPHFHRAFSESFYVLAGTVELYDGTGWVQSSPGDFLYVPEGGVHGFRIAADKRASMLILFAPGRRGNGTSRSWQRSSNRGGSSATKNGPSCLLATTSTWSDTVD